MAYNAQNTIERCINSVLQQSLKNIQYIIVDGGSTDDTIKIIDKYSTNVDAFISEPDNGIYDAMNKGIALATGDVIGTINADDFFADNDVLYNIAKVFAEQDTAIIYGDLDYIDPNDKVIRKWRSGKYRKGIFNWGWMPPHPTFYCKRSLFEKLGGYKLDYGSAGDYELMLRFIHQNNINAYYLNKVLIKMVVGGISNKSLGNRVQAMRFDLKAMKNNSIFLPIVTILLKPLRKIAQFF
ncbi:glycosyltransferase family 2 protein [Mucilaginibacter sp. BT774]|uniref:glycosyltransferase family 2 protein n=1 Tax=Mucilaginibacter sp. BT774 TaxID=3062276 RepID=UPI002677221E|nr:glycosyltransferase family 2 protein [Mucilaginibacter sp. BT774]MDO3624975.1 glycosyltransferase family 2 protein [Mucilaginibacter sp. BT774]